jgi:hypothetical protein
MRKNKIVDDDGKLGFERMPRFKISKEYRPTMEMNQDNFKATGLWFSMHMVFENQDNQRL